ncbi:dihydrolipoamide acetyltransferase [Chlorella sorokiniana]|uniref:Dihydrolipoamide acetyltransferase n=1 Tax=Chlorella sorokiniana TaxID=3076 RepID=A0A2P6TGA3_CHLSO|nr:dihydrolipoamide acetyltransferase [Chlorella sorokiniana]|eukprot:PRW33154.1 dihydrolipoamide acetyltransferase [Chlorella sorokiniana]
MQAARQQALRGVRSALAAPAAVSGEAWWSAAVATAGFHNARQLLSSLQVKIPALGESIADGTVAAVLKQVGDRVEEDEPILQIETDKVTVDVRAPKAGIVEAILVKPDDNVEVGHVVASIGPLGSTAAAEAPQPAATQQQQAAAEPPPPPAAAAPRQAAAAPAAAPSAAAALAHREPSIRFPPRRTAEGEQISALPRTEAERMMAQLLGGGAQQAQQAQREPIPEEYKHMIAVPIVGGSRPILRGMPVPSGPPGPPRRTMTDAEMEAIMLGGADP